MFHLAAFFESVDQTLDNIAALADQVLFTSGDDLVVSDDYRQILAAWAGSASAERARIVAASLRGKVLPDLQPVETDPEPNSPVQGLHEFWQHPIELQSGERVNVQVENDGAGAAEAVFAGLWLGKGPISPSPGRWLPVRAVTAAAAVTADVWTSRTLTLAQSLPPGRYEVGGMRAQSTSLVLARLIFPGQTMRPGTLGVDADSDIQPAVFRRGGLGVWGTFTHDQPPTIELLCDAADNEAQQIVLDVRRVG